jgi:4'-phosphopantetheinyl transferase
MVGDIAAHLFRLDPRSLSEGESYERCLQLLSPTERTRHDRLAVEDRRRELAATYALVRLALAEVSGAAPSAWSVRRDSLGRPIVEGPMPGLHVSVTHTPGLVACLIAPCVAGVDAEQVSPRVPYMRIAEQVFSPTELASLRCLDDEPQRTDRFFLLWSVKEALAKARGEGLAAPLQRITVTLGDDGHVDVDMPADCGAGSARWDVRWSRPTSEHVLATCLSTESADRTPVVEHVGLPEISQ